MTTAYRTDDQGYRYYPNADAAEQALRDGLAALGWTQDPMFGWVLVAPVERADEPE